MNSRNLYCFLLFSLLIFNIPELVSQPVPDNTTSSNKQLGVHQLSKNKTLVLFPTAEATVSSSAGNFTLKVKSVTAALDKLDNAQTEDIIELPKLIKDNRGHWVYNPWPVTFGNRILDTRFTKSQPYVHINVVSNPKRFYDPQTDMSTVCMGSTIPHGDFKVSRWMDRHIYRHRQISQAFYMQLRRDVYINGKSEMCHDKKYSKWMDYQQCALRRNQRLESYIPQYPLHQLVRENS
ncbi:uncharacterized protein LOC111601807 [Drosophila hydei]|uniref:Uncharacterized protein LOC111601807 n=1 Tax=Drosophila hydei TaxID=7224 RepID=A0A6J1M0T3_DROHY|nr:uncharacterized protein LOC111601807 [Drosophila hydei]